MANKDEELLVPVCPECRAGKHGNCDGTALDTKTDEITTCICYYLQMLPGSVHQIKE